MGGSSNTTTTTNTKPNHARSTTLPLLPSQPQPPPSSSSSSLPEGPTLYQNHQLQQQHQIETAIANTKTDTSTTMSNNTDTLGLMNQDRDAATTATTTTTIAIATTAAAPSAVAPSSTRRAPINTSSETEPLKVRHWKSSPFAVGLVEPTWADEHADCSECFCGATDPHYASTAITSTTSTSISMQRRHRNNKLPCHLWCSGWVCSRLGADRVGNMAVLAQSMERVEINYSMDPVTRQIMCQTVQRPKLWCVVGPYWIVPATLTIPIMGGISIWTATTSLMHHSLGVIIGWVSCTILLFVSLFMVACRDPGILYRHARPPPPPPVDSQQVTSTSSSSSTTAWRWNDQAQTFRPPKAKFDPECAVVIEEFDHTCPWTGTAIAKKNMMWFRLFVVSVLVCLLFNMILITTARIN